MTFLAKNKSKNKISSLQILLFILVGVILSLVAFFIYSNIIILISTILSVVILFFYLLSKPKDIEINIAPDKFKYKNTEIIWEEVIAWTIVDLDEELEFIIYTSHFGVNFYYFYLEKSNLKTSKIASVLSQNAPYNKEIAELDKIHFFLRKLNLI